MSAAGENLIVTAEDQQSINKFARLHQSLTTLTDEVKSLLNDVQNLNEAADEIMLLGEEDAVPLKMGTSFIHFSPESAGSRLETLKSNAEEKAEQKKNEKSVIEAEMKRLKTSLYAKFGDKINLESESDD